MYWADNFADQIISSGKYKPYWVDDMKTPSGRVHIGSVRAVISHQLIHQSLSDRGVKAEFSYILEDHDPFDKIPQYLDKKVYEPHLGKPLYKVPSPEPGFKSYSHRWGKEYQEIFNLVGAHPQVHWGSQLYLSGKMNAVIRQCLDQSDKIKAIYKTLYNQDRPRDWLPISMVCQKCGKISTTSATSWDGHQVTYICQTDLVDWTKGCGHSGKNSPFDGNAKLPWKVEWPCKWKVIGVTVEGAGKDHMSDGGSHDFAKLMCQQVINYPVPFAFSHEFFLVGGRKMSSSKGIGTSAKEISEIIPAYLIRFLVVKVKYNRAINFDPNGDMIPDAFDQYDQAALAFWDQTDSKLARIYQLSQIDTDPPKPHFLPRFRDVAKFLQDPKIKLEEKFSQIKGSNLTDQEKMILTERVSYAQIWLKDYAPPSYKNSFTDVAAQNLPELSEQQIVFLKELSAIIDQHNQDAQKLQKSIYDLAKQHQLPTNQAFQAIYQTLLGKNYGPQAAWLILENPLLVLEKFSNLPKAANTKTNIKSTKKLKSKHLALTETLSETYPTIVAAYAILKDVTITDKDNELQKQREQFLAETQGLTTQQLGQYPEIQSYRAMYKKMGIDWHSRRPSPEALLRRVALGKGLYSINTCVDAYNLVVMKNRVSVGAFDLDQIKLPIEIKISQGGEKIHLLGDDDQTTIKPGEVCYFDKLGPYNLDFNYRDAQRTKVTSDTKNLWINVEGVGDITKDQVATTLNQTIDIIRKYCGGKVIDSSILSAS